MRNPRLLKALAVSFVAGEATAEQIALRARRTMGRDWRCVRALGRRYAEIYGGRPRPRQQEVAEFLLKDAAFRRAWTRYGDRLPSKRLTFAQKMQPTDAARKWKIPAIETISALADWLGISVSELRWFADLKGITAKSRDTRLSHYHYRVLAKDSGSARLIEAPKTRLKEIQRRILDRILNAIPIHPAAHGFVKGRSIKTFAAPHVGRRVVLKMDLKDFFPSISGRRIQALFRTAGYPEAVADLLGGLCANAAPRSVWRGCQCGTMAAEMHHVRDFYWRPHLPQGAPTSPALANLCGYRVDCRLTGLATTAGAVYTRYADDLAFSGDERFVKCVERFAAQVAAILLEEGFEVQHRKTRVMRRGVRQYLAGIVVNERLNAVRADFDRLKAILTNCVRHGPESQNRDAHRAFRAHIEGRVGFVESVNPKKGGRLRKLLEQIVSS